MNDQDALIVLPELLIVVSEILSIGVAPVSAKIGVGSRRGCRRRGEPLFSSRKHTQIV